MLRVVWGLALLCVVCGCSSSQGSAPPAHGVTWSADFTGKPRQLSAAPDGTVFVLLAAAPWLVRHGSDGRPSALALEGELDWVNGLVAANDGSLYVAGTTSSSGDPADDEVRVDHLSPSGAQLASARWTLPKPAGSGSTVADATEFASISRAADGTIDVLASAEFGRAVVHLTTDGALDSRTSIPAVFDVRGEARDTTNPTRLADAPDGSYLTQGGSSTLWVQRSDASALSKNAWWVGLASSSLADTVYAGGATHAANGGWFVAVGVGFSDRVSGIGFYHRGILRLSEDGRRVWGNGDYFEPSALGDDAELRHVSLALLADSVLLAVAVPDADPRNADDVALSPDQRFATLIRYSLKGDYAQSWELGKIIDTAAVGPEAAVVLKTSDDQANRYTLQRLDFDPLTVPLAAVAEPCSVTEDCASGACCASATGLFAVTCSAQATCGEGDYCTDDAHCDGTCQMNPDAANQGFCAARCGAVTDCPARATCVDRLCLPLCTTNDDCPYRGTQCTDVSNVEASHVSVCVAGSAPPERFPS